MSWAEDNNIDIGDIDDFGDLIDDSGKDAEYWKAMFIECLDDLKDWSEYASDYFKEKYKLAETIQRYEDALK